MDLRGIGNAVMSMLQSPADDPATADAYLTDGSSYSIELDIPLSPSALNTAESPVHPSDHPTAHPHHRSPSPAQSHPPDRPSAPPSDPSVASPPPPPPHSLPAPTSHTVPLATLPAHHRAAAPPPRTTAVPVPRSPPPLSSTPAAPPFAPTSSTTSAARFAAARPPASTATVSAAPTPSATAAPPPLQSRIHIPSPSANTTSAVAARGHLIREADVDVASHATLRVLCRHLGVSAVGRKSQLRKRALSTLRTRPVVSEENTHTLHVPRVPRRPTSTDITTSTRDVPDARTNPAAAPPQPPGGIVAKSSVPFPPTTMPPPPAPKPPKPAMCSIASLRLPMEASRRDFAAASTNALPSPAVSSTRSQLHLHTIPPTSPPPVTLRTPSSPIPVVTSRATADFSPSKLAEATGIVRRSSVNQVFHGRMTAPDERDETRRPVRIAQHVTHPQMQRTAIGDFQTPHADHQAQNRSLIQNQTNSIPSPSHPPRSTTPPGFVAKSPQRSHPLVIASATHQPSNPIQSSIPDPNRSSKPSPPSSDSLAREADVSSAQPKSYSVPVMDRLRRMLRSSVPIPPRSGLPNGSDAAPSGRALGSSSRQPAQSDEIQRQPQPASVQQPQWTAHAPQEADPNIPPDSVPLTNQELVRRFLGDQPSTANEPTPRQSNRVSAPILGSSELASLRRRSRVAASQRRPAPDAWNINSLPELEAAIDADPKHTPELMSSLSVRARIEKSNPRQSSRRMSIGLRQLMEVPDTPKPPPYRTTQPRERQLTREEQQALFNETKRRLFGNATSIVAQPRLPPGAGSILERLKRKNRELRAKGVGKRSIPLPDAPAAKRARRTGEFHLSGGPAQPSAGSASAFQSRAPNSEAPIAGRSVRSRPSSMRSQGVNRGNVVAYGCGPRRTRPASVSGPASAALKADMQNLTSNEKPRLRLERKRTISFNFHDDDADIEESSKPPVFTSAPATAPPAASDRPPLPPKRSEDQVAENANAITEQDNAIASVSPAVPSISEPPVADGGASLAISTSFDSQKVSAFPTPPAFPSSSKEHSLTFAKNSQPSERSSAPNFGVNPGNTAQVPSSVPTSIPHENKSAMEHVEEPKPLFETRLESVENTNQASENKLDPISSNDNDKNRSTLMGSAVSFDPAPVEKLNSENTNQNTKDAGSKPFSFGKPLSDDAQDPQSDTASFGQFTPFSFKPSEAKKSALTSPFSVGQSDAGQNVSKSKDTTPDMKGVPKPLFNFGAAPAEKESSKPAGDSNLQQEAEAKTKDTASLELAGNNKGVFGIEKSTDKKPESEQVHTSPFSGASPFGSTPFSAGNSNATTTARAASGFNDVSVKPVEPSPFTFGTAAAIKTPDDRTELKSTEPAPTGKSELPSKVLSDEVKESNPPVNTEFSFGKTTSFPASNPFGSAAGTTPLPENAEEKRKESLATADPSTKGQEASAEPMATTTPPSKPSVFGSAGGSFSFGQNAENEKPVFGASQGNSKTEQPSFGSKPDNQPTPIPAFGSSTNATESTPAFSFGGTPSQPVSSTLTAPFAGTQFNPSTPAPKNANSFVFGSSAPPAPSLNHVSSGGFSSNPTAFGASDGKPFQFNTAPPATSAASGPAFGSFGAGAQSSSSGTPFGPSSNVAPTTAFGASSSAFAPSHPFGSSSSVAPSPFPGNSNAESAPGFGAGTPAAPTGNVFGGNTGFGASSQPSSIPAGAPSFGTPSQALANPFGSASALTPFGQAAPVAAAPAAGNLPNSSGGSSFGNPPPGMTFNVQQQNAQTNSAFNMGAASAQPRNPSRRRRLVARRTLK